MVKNNIEEHDGYYYKKIVENVKKDICSLNFFGFILFGMFIGSLLYPLISSKTNLYLLLILYPIFAICIWILSYFANHEKKVKFVKIGKIK